MSWTKYYSALDGKAHFAVPIPPLGHYDIDKRPNEDRYNSATELWEHLKKSLENISLRGNEMVYGPTPREGYSR